LEAVRGKLEKGSANGTDLVALRLGAPAADNLPSMDQKPVVNEEVRVMFPCHKLGPLALPGPSGPHKGKDFHPVQQIFRHGSAFSRPL